ncbi:MAG: peptidase C14, partial [Acidimicrobiales bacterium]
MTNYNFIGIGINSYQHLQPLSYAQADIEGLERFFCEEARLSSRQTLTFTDNSSWVNEEPTYPTQKNLLDWLNSGFNHNAPKTNRGGASILWFAFSGYAVQHLGEDYLLPIDAKLEDPAATGIPVSKVFNALRQQGAGK